MDRPAIEMFTRSRYAMALIANIHPINNQRTRPWNGFNMVSRSCLLDAGSRAENLHACGSRARMAPGCAGPGLRSGPQRVTGRASEVQFGQSGSRLSGFAGYLP